MRLSLNLRVRWVVARKEHEAEWEMRSGLASLENSVLQCLKLIQEWIGFSRSDIKHFISLRIADIKPLQNHPRIPTANIFMATS